MEEKIFKAYDIRGVYPEEVNEEVAYKIGRAFITLLGKKNPRIIIGRDGRLSSPSLFDSLKKGIIDSGGNVTNTGLSNTPLLNFSVANFGYDGGVMVTASHNPPEFNGFKIIRDAAFQIHGEKIEEIKRIIDREEFKDGEGKEEEKSFLSYYTDHLLKKAGDLSGMQVVVDCGNGVGSITAKPFFSKTKAKASFLYDEIDGSFPYHLPDPQSTEASVAIREKVKEETADLGVMFDGDADRCLLIDEKGEVVSPDHLLCLLAREELGKHPGEKVYYDLRFSMIVEEAVRQAGGIPVIMRVGNPFYKEKIIKEGGILGAELSGHIMFRENFGIDDGLFALVKTLTIMAEKKEKLSSLLSPFKKYFQTEEINMEVRDKDKALEKARRVFDGGKEISIDGVYVRYSNWWFSLRKSNTEDLVRLRIEAKRKDLLEEKRKELVSLIKSS